MSIIIFLLVLSVLILIHESGHFIAAKRSGVKVFEFALGFPPTLYKKTIRGTQYVLNALPFGGYVRLLGENGEDDNPIPSEVVTDKENFSKKSPLTKSYVLAAGVAMNMLLAWVLFSICLLFGYPTATSEVRANDQRYVINESTIITGVVKDSPAEKAGLLPSDALLSISDDSRTVEITTAGDLANFITSTTSEDIKLTVERGKEQLNLSMKPSAGIEGIADGTKAIGVISTDVSVIRYPILRAFYEGARWTVNATTQTIEGLAGLLTNALRGRGNFSSVSGPVGIVHLVGQAYSVGILTLFAFTAIISINLAVINLLPIPALDGGRILFVWIEAIMRKPLPMKAQLIANGVGFALLMLLMLIITIHDVRNLFI